jgi:hypothetical protein
VWQEPPLVFLQRTVVPVYAAGRLPYGSDGTGCTLPPQMKALMLGRFAGSNVPCITMPGGSSESRPGRSFVSMLAPNH